RRSATASDSSSSRTGTPSSTAPRASCTRRSQRRERGTSRRASSPSRGGGGTEPSWAGVVGRWLFPEGLQSPRRPPPLAVLLIVYPVAIAVLIGFALSRGPEKPRVAFLNEVPAGTPLIVGGTEFDITGARSELCSRLDCIPVSTEAQARQMVQSGDALAALILPPDLITNLESLGGLN